MKFRCECGHVIYDGGNPLTYKCKLGPEDGYWDEFHQPLIDGILDLARSVAKGDRDGWLSRHFASGYPRDLDDESVISDFIAARTSRFRPAYQCTECGSLFIQKKLGGDFVMFMPVDSDWPDILSSQD